MAVEGLAVGGKVLTGSRNGGGEKVERPKK